MAQSQECTVEKGQPVQKILGNWTITSKRMKPDPYFTPSTKISSKQIQDLSVKTYNHKTPRRNRGKLLDVGLGDNVLEFDTKSKDNKRKISKWDYIKLKSFCKQRIPSIM